MGKSLNQAKANAVRYTKKKVEHWQVVSLALAGYDAVYDPKGIFGSIP